MQVVFTWVDHNISGRARPMKSDPMPIEDNSLLGETDDDTKANILLYLASGPYIILKQDGEWTMYSVASMHRARVVLVD